MALTDIYSRFDELQLRWEVSIYPARYGCWLLSDESYKLSYAFFSITNTTIRLWSESHSVSAFFQSLQQGLVELRLLFWLRRVPAPLPDPQLQVSKRGLYPLLKRRCPDAIILAAGVTWFRLAARRL